MRTTTYTRRHIYGSIQRALHWWLALTTVGAAVTGAIAQWGLDAGEGRVMLLKAHVQLGMALAAGVALRLLWAVIGPASARASRMWQAARRTLRPEKQTREPFAYEPAAGAAYLTFYASLMVSVVSGLALAAIRYDIGPLSEILFDDFSRHALFLIGHESASYMVVIFIVTHLVGMKRHEQRSGQPVAQAMVSGYKYEPVSEERLT